MVCLHNTLVFKPELSSRPSLALATVRIPPVEVVLAVAAPPAAVPPDDDDGDVLVVVVAAVD